MRTAEGDDRDARLRPADRRARLDLARAADPGPDASTRVGFKTLSDAIALRNQIVQTLERAESVDDEAARRALLTYVFVGAGYAGLEGLAELQDFAADVVDLYPRSRVQGLRFILVEARERVMPEISADLAAFATAELRRRGVEVRTSTTVERISADSVELSDGELVPVPDGRVDGRRAAASGRRESSGCRSTEAGRIVVDRFCQVEGRSDVWAIGDAAAVPDPAGPGQPTPPTCQHALRQGRTVARQRRRRAGRGQAEAVHLQDARRVRRHGAPEGGRRDGRDQVARLPGVVPRPQLPPVDDAGHQAPAPARGRLDRRPAVRPRRVRARPARPPAGARDAAGRRRGGRAVAR